MVPGVLLIPWTFHLVTSPSAFFGEAGLVRPGLAAAHLRPGSLLLLSPGGPGLPPAWVTAGLVLPAFAALLTRRRTALVYAGWGVALGGLILALVVSRATVTPPQGGAAVSAWPGLAIAIAAAGLLLAATPLIEAIGRALGWPGRRPRGAGPAPTGASSPRWPGLAAAVWRRPWRPATGWPTGWRPGDRGRPAGPARLRGGVGDRARPGQDAGAPCRTAPGRCPTPSCATPTRCPASPNWPRPLPPGTPWRSVVASLPAAGSGDAGDTGRALSQFGIGYVLLPAPVDQALARQLNAAAGLQPLTRAPSYDLWQVSGTVARARVLTPGGAAVAVPSGPVGVNATVAPGTSGTLVLAEAAGGWSATLDGRPLTPLAAPVDGWAQGFTLPAGGGHLVITRNETARNLGLGAEAAALLAAFVLALPGSRSSVRGARRGRTPSPSPRPAAAPPATPAPGRPAPGAASRAERQERQGAGRRRARAREPPQAAAAPAPAARACRPRCAGPGRATNPGRLPGGREGGAARPVRPSRGPGYGGGRPRLRREPAPGYAPRPGLRPRPRSPRRTWRGSRALGRARLPDHAGPGQGPARPRARRAPPRPRRRGAAAARHAAAARQAVAPPRGDG